MRSIVFWFWINILRQLGQKLLHPKMHSTLLLKIYLLFIHLASSFVLFVRGKSLCCQHHYKLHGNIIANLI